MMEVMDVHVGPKSMADAQTYNDHRIIKERSPQRPCKNKIFGNVSATLSDASKLTRSSCRAEKLAENDVFEESKGLLCAPGIAD